MQLKSVPVALATAGMLAGSFVAISIPTAAKTKPVTITFAEAMSSGTLKTTMQSLVAQFEKAYPGIKVSLLTESSYGVLNEKTEAMLAAKNPPTIAQAYEDWAAEYKAADAIVPLSSFVNGKNGLTKKETSDFWAPVWKDQFLNGKLYMWPFNKSDFVMYYNASWLKKEHQAVPATWAQFAKVAKAITSKAKDQWALSIDPGSTGEGAANGTYLYMALVEAWGGHLMQNGKPDFNSPQAKAALAYLKGLYQDGALKLGTSYPGQTAMGAEHGAFDLSTIASYYYDQSADGGKFAMGVAAMPKGPSGEGNILQGTNIVMFQRATRAQKNAAWTFMKWLTEPVNTAYWATHTGYLPVRKSAINFMKGYYQSHPYQKIAASSLAYAQETPPVAWFDQAAGDLGNAIQAAVTGTQSVASALNQAQAQALQAASGQP
jgi:multiple sugar transport system substrate-binding protein